MTTVSTIHLDLRRRFFAVAGAGAGSPGATGSEPFRGGESGSLSGSPP
jgi:hypothetical protein